ncbi:unnamed protein product [Discosporangium mesarthrocarpum]
MSPWLNPRMINTKTNPNQVLVGPTPPKHAMKGRGGASSPLKVADRLAAFLQAHPALTGNPDVVLVSEPSGSPLAPDKAAVMVGCRGFAAMEVSVSTFVEQGEWCAGKSRSCTDFGGPLIDPGRVLSAILSSLHDQQSGGVAVRYRPSFNYFCSWLR